MNSLWGLITIPAARIWNNRTLNNDTNRQGRLTSSGERPGSSPASPSKATNDSNNGFVLSPVTLSPVQLSGATSPVTMARYQQQRQGLVTKDRSKDNTILLYPDGDVADTQDEFSQKGGTEGKMKRVRFIRHGCGIHNETLDFNNPRMLDARLTPKGVKQCEELKAVLRGQGELQKAELVVASTLGRALETAMLVYGDEIKEKKLRCVSTELCREELSTHQCDKRRTIMEQKLQFPFFDFSGVKNDVDVLWTNNKRAVHPAHMSRKKRPFATWTRTGPKVWWCFIENEELLVNRATEFLQWIMEQPEQEIAVISHANFLGTLFRDHVTPSTLQSPLQALAFLSRFGNCETRVVKVCSVPPP
eukprot:CAMPEP_0184697576 /NCGR_PEP_ID=MMETSP0313-20130426/4500_1 /TAXON_ID=2792 /ORGANISM="Porphyridium aerugineum, Strain SAG 1380-2" /LENGTH=360 /DNA_ID=CAMNT_0027156391 /DNA_START=107 /DNA_END=1189 /DNA_ORIENTATION=-